MNRTTFALFAVLLASPAFAQLPPVFLTVDPVAEPKPALRYTLLPAVRDFSDGSAVNHYLKAVKARPTVEKAMQPESEKQLATWEEADLAKLPVADVKKHLERYALAFVELESGTRCKRIGAKSYPFSGVSVLEDTIAVQPAIRDLARQLALRVRVALVMERYDDAVADIRTGLQFGKHVGEGSSLIEALVGYAVVNLFLTRVEELLTRPGAPSLYWALATLPRPLIDPRPGSDGEDVLSEGFLPGLSELRKGPVSAEVALDAAEAAMKVLAAVEGGRTLDAVGGRLAISGQAALNQESARKDLLARGWDKKTVAAMPAVQAVYMNAYEAYRDLADDNRKWLLTPLPESFDGLVKAAARRKKVQKDRQGDGLFQALLLVIPPVEKVHHAAARTERRVAMLRAVEAVRVHADAAAALPKALADIKKVPVPTDPLTAEPFGFTTTADGFTLRSPESDAVPKALDVRYEVRVRK